MTTAEERWRRIVDPQFETLRVTAGTGFGRSSGLRISGKIYAMLVNDELVVKLPKERVDDLVASGVGHRFDPGHGRVMKEWASLPVESSRRWRALVDEARAFVDPC